MDDPLLTPIELLNNLIQFIGERQTGHSESIQVDNAKLAAWIGAPVSAKTGESNLDWLLYQPITAEMVEVREPSHLVRTVRLTMRGWEYFSELQKKVEQSRNVLMAMRFGDSELDHAVDNCFKPAVARTGFQLRRINENQAAGLIDDQLRVALRTSRFIIADLTHNNSGAYWEAGFVEGLGRPVIYSCRKAEWEEQRTHFDTNHLVTIVWDPNDLKKAGEQLTATIRATLPSEAKLLD